ncbi:MAG: tRNA (N(6)-L-threonylcarbamoyladenosine(37)-C(2))-methylthiotransferase MtaB [Planctomycetota bacterium]|nr:tRNA (N(6)-L-threonylcarbamoyladenosine(37)-C(2))-methylthiotransferase MtaB [Planctomycetota bacterium]MDA1163810.1 tRNA (N(6)-L-threonylcarbamoyladenosine(37)-C(2))-methylthiotransferase MtaB [Planctomycetota bacterium]
MSERTCRLVTLGCKVNQYETQLVKESLLSSGFREAAEDEAADLCFVNTCTVTGEADSKGRQLIRQLAKKNPGTRTIVMGCYATRDPEVLRDLPGVFEVVSDKRELPDVLNRLGIVDIPDGISHFDGRRRAFVKIQDGCILRCTYCIIPEVRPGLRSRSPESIYAEVRRLIDNGYREIVLSGIHVGHYGVDTTRAKSGLPPFRLWHLFEKLDRIPGDWRMRLSSIEAVEVNDEFIRTAASCEHLCPQFHPSLQSGSEAVLRRMRRRYSIEKFLDKLEQMREQLDNPAFTTDVIVGFPGETDAEFQETLAACRRARFMKIHVFPFSKRKGTPAADFENQVAPEVRKDRCQILSDLERDLAEEYYQTLVGRELEVLVEGVSRKRPGWVHGNDRRYAPVEVPGTTDDIGKFVSAHGESAGRHQVTAVRVGSESIVGSR